MNAKKLENRIFSGLIIIFLILPIAPTVILFLNIETKDETSLGVNAESSTEGQKVVDYFNEVFESDWAMGEDYDPEEDDTGEPQSRDIKGSGYEPVTSEQIKDEMKITPILSPDNAEVEIIKLINSAEETLYIEQMYIYDDLTDIIDAIVNAHNRGVDVKIILDDTDNDDSKAAADYLNGEGIPLKICTSTVPQYFDTQHNKGVLVDGKKVLISSINWSPTSLRYNRETGIIIESSDVTSYYLALFNHDWSVCEEYDSGVHLQSSMLMVEEGDPVEPAYKNNMSSKNSIKQITHNIFLPGYGIKNPVGLMYQTFFFNPSYSNDFEEVKTYSGEMTVLAMASPDNCFEGVAGILSKAEKSIDISVYTLSSPYLIDILAERMKKEVKVRLLLEKNQVGSYERAYNRYVMNNLTEIGVSAGLATHKAEGLWASQDFDFQHSKYAIIDDSILILSSGNWARSSCPKAQDDGDVDGNRDWWIIIYGSDVPTDDLPLFIIIIIIIVVIAVVAIVIVVKVVS